jgi:hypothetical protein
VHGLGGEMAAGTKGMAAVNLAMHSKLRRSGRDIIPEIMDKFREGFELTAGRSRLLEVTDHANADSGIIDILTPDMTAVELLEPARPDFDLPVTRIDAVADDEVVGKAVNHAHALTMKAIVDSRVAAIDGAVMSHHIFPTGSLKPDLACGSDHVANIAVSHGRTRTARNQELLSHKNPIAAQTVRLPDGSHAHIVAAGNDTEGFTTNDNMNQGFARPGWHEERLPGQDTIPAQIVGCPEFGDGDSSITRDGSEGVAAFNRVRRESIVGAQGRTTEKQAGPREEAQPEKATPVPIDHKVSQSIDRSPMQPFPEQMWGRVMCDRPERWGLLVNVVWGRTGGSRSRWRGRVPGGNSL